MSRQPLPGRPGSVPARQRHPRAHDTAQRRLSAAGIAELLEMTASEVLSSMSVLQPVRGAQAASSDVGHDLAFAPVHVGKSGHAALIAAGSFAADLTCPPTTVRPAERDRALLRALDERGGTLGSDAAERAWGARDRKSSAEARKRLARMAADGLVRPLDGEKPVAWVRTRAGTEVLGDG